MSNLKKFASFLALMGGDIAALLLSFLAAYVLRSTLLPSLLHFDQPPLPLGHQLGTYFLLEALILVSIFAFEKLYIKRLSFWEEVRSLWKSIALSFIILLVIVFITRSYARFSRVVLILTFFFCLILIPVVRLATKKTLVRMNLWKKRVLILGVNQAAERIIEGLKKNPILGYEIIGLLADKEDRTGQEITLPDRISVLGGIDDVEKVSREVGAQDIIIALPSLDRRRMIELVERCEQLTETIRIVPEMGSLFTLGVETENLGDVLSLSVARNLAKPWNIALKRFFEFWFAVLTFTIFSPVFLVIAAAIKIDSKGPVFFAQERLGQGGRTFRMIKFRSMDIDGDAKLKDYLRKNSGAREDWETFQKIRTGDPRVTRVGKFMRKYSLDEIPQLLNVIRGQMSLVGPRPYLPREREIMGEAYNIISKVKPAITGLWQVSGRNILSFKERLALDEYYIRNWSFWQDIVILLRTVKALAKNEGAY